MRSIFMAGFLPLLAGSALEARPLTVDDIDNIRPVASPAVDPSGKWVAYSVSTVDRKADKNVSHV